MLHIVIMSGGSGTRFWPRSRDSQPKQLLFFIEGRSLLQDTVARVLDLVPAGQGMWIITNSVQAPETRRQVAALAPQAQIIEEPVGRDTAACIGLAASLIAQTDPDAILAVLPADHLIEPARSFSRLLSQAARQVQPSQVITFGARPHYPATGFGYIELGESFPKDSPEDAPLHRVQSFKEKPLLETAQRWLAEGGFLWNCGIFVWHAETIMAQLRANKPKLAADLSELTASFGTKAFEAEMARRYPSLEKISIDYAVLEHCKNIAVLPIDFDWRDLGSWTAIEELTPPQVNGHRVDKAEHISVDSSRCFISGDGRLVATIGVDDLIIVQTKDATLICRRGEEQKVKAVVDELRRRGRTDLIQ